MPTVVAMTVVGVRRALAATASAVIAGSALVGGAHAAHAEPVSGCQWIDGEYVQSYDCTDPIEEGELSHLDIIECWASPPSPRTYVSTKAPKTKWKKNKAIDLTISESKDCSSDFPYRTRIRIPADMLETMKTTRLRLTMPASEGELPDGTAFAYGKTRVTYGACLMPESAGDWCPER